MSIESREIGSKADFKEKGSIVTAKKWCEEARSILGFRFSGKANDLRKTINDVTGDLEKIEDLMVFASSAEQLSDKLEKHQKDFREAAWELERLSKLYEQYEAAKKKAKWRSKQEKAAAAKMDEIKSQIESQVAAMQTQRDQLHRTVAVAEEKQAAQQELIKNKPDYKQITAARKHWNSHISKGRKYVATFQKSYDAVTAGTASDELDAMLRDHDWLVIENATDAQRYESEANAFVEKWKARAQNYIAGKKAYQSAKKDAVHWMEQAQTYLSDNAMSTIAKKYYEGMNAANNHQYDVAGDRINPRFVEILKTLVEPVISKHGIWETIKSDQYASLRAQVERLSIREYCQVAMIGLSEVVALADKDKNFESAIEKFPALETETSRIIDVETQFRAKTMELINKIGPIESIIRGYTEDAFTFASPRLEDLEKVSGEFFARCVDQPFKQTVVPTQTDVDQVFAELTQRLDEIKTEVERWSDPANVAQKNSELAAEKNYRPLLEDLTLQIATTRSAIFEYQALGNDPAGDPARIKEWNSKADGAETYVSRRERDLENGEAGDYDEIVARLNTEKAAFANIVDPVISGLTSAAQTEIEAARTILRGRLEILEPLLKESRWVNLRQAKWNETAKAELALMQVILDTDNKDLLEQKTAVANTLIDYANNVLDESYSEQFPQFQIKYDVLKDKLSSLKKRVNKKAVKRVLPQEQAKYGGKSGLISALKMELREAGPGSMATEHAAWLKRVTDMENEVQTKVLDLIDELAAARKVCDEKLAALKDRLFGELITAVRAATGKTISPNNLPIMDEVLGCEGLMNVTKEVGGYQQLARRMDNINTQITWLIQDGAKDAFASLLLQDSTVDSEIMDSAEESMRFQARYRLAKENYANAWRELRTKDDVDQVEKKRIVGLYDTARKLAGKEDWKNAAQKMDLASRMMTLLKDNPQGSGVTGRGRNHLNELDLRWKNGVGTLLSSVNKLEEAIKTSCESAEEYGKTDAAADQVNAAKIVEKFHTTVPVPFEAEMPLRAFERDLIVLQAEPPRKSDAKLKDRENKKKYRERALVKVRQFKSLVSSAPMYKAIVFTSNPWSKKNGNVNGLELMRALNDLDLNIQRAVD